MRIPALEQIEPRYDVLVLNAHPDDVEMAIGGTLLRLVDEGKRVLSVIYTRGDAGRHGTVEERIAETQRAADYGGYDFLFLEHPDCGLFFDRDSRDETVRIIRRARPRLVLAPYHTNDQGHHDGINHEDHLAVGRMAQAAMKIARKTHYSGVDEEPWLPDRIAYFMVPRYTVPSLLVDVSDLEPRIRELISCFETQTRIRRAGKPILDVLLEWRRTMGYTVGLDLAEALLMDEPLIVGEAGGICGRIVGLKGEEKNM